MEVRIIVNGFKILMTTTETCSAPCATKYQLLKLEMAYYMIFQKEIHPKSLIQPSDVIASFLLLPTPQKPSKTCSLLNRTKLKDMV